MAVNVIRISDTFHHTSLSQSSISKCGGIVVGLRVPHELPPLYTPNDRNTSSFRRVFGELSTMEHVQRETGRIDDQYTLMDSLKEKKCRH